MKFLRLMPGKGEVVLAEGDPELSEDEERLIEEFRRQLDSGMWAAVPIDRGSTRAAARRSWCKDFAEIPRGAERVDLLPARRGRLDRSTGRCRRSRSVVAGARGAGARAPISRRGERRASLARRPRRAAARGRRRAQRIDPGTERRAERRARALLRSIVNREEWEMYRDLGFIRVHRAQTRATRPATGGLRLPDLSAQADRRLPAGVEQPAERVLRRVPRPRASASTGPKLPDSDDVLAKWMMIKADEERLIRGANMHLPGRQVDPQQVRRDLWRLAEWERAPARRAQRAASRVSA